jgi:hypothetical protein
VQTGGGRLPTAYTYRYTSDCYEDFGPRNYAENIPEYAPICLRNASQIHSEKACILIPIEFLSRTFTLSKPF